MWKLVVGIPVSFFLLTLNAEADQPVDSLIFKNGTAVGTVIIGIDSSVVYLADRPALGLTSISSIITRNDSIADAINAFYPEIPIVRGDSLTTITLQNTTIATRKPSSDRVLHSLSLLANYQTDPHENAELQLTFSLRALPNFVGQIAASSGLHFGTDEERADRFSLGIGYRTAGQYFSLVTIINIGERQSVNHAGGSYSTVTSDWSVYAQLGTLNGGLFLSTGLKFHLRKGNPDDSPTSFNFGIGVPFALDN